MMQRKRRKKKNWSYNAGERGRNWVRAFQQARDGRYFVEWFDEHRKRRAALLKGVTDPNQAKARADELAAKFATLEPGLPAAPEKITLVELLDRYIGETSLSRRSRQQDHDAASRRTWLAFLDAQPERGRRGGRRPESLDRIDWDRFVAMRRADRIPGWPHKVKDRAVQRDLMFMLAVLNWGMGAKLIQVNPWSREIRRHQRWTTPSERNPHRPVMTDEIRKGLIAHSSSWKFAAMLRLGRETLRRNSSIRQLLWSDIDLRAETIRWRAESDKAGRASVTPMTPAAVEVIRSLPRGIGDVPVFPGRAGRPVSRHGPQLWLRRAKARWIRSVPKEQREELRARLRGVGFHAEKRAGVRDPSFRELPVAVQEALTGTNAKTLRTIYDRVEVDEMRTYMKRASQASE